MYTLISFATQWGSRYGGINTFNTELLKGFGAAYSDFVNTVCVVASATDQEIIDAAHSCVTLIPLPYAPQGNKLTADHAQVALSQLERHNVAIDKATAVWMGHDLFTGACANMAAKSFGGRSTVIHHMSYDHYESYAEKSASAYEKKLQQKDIFEKADILFAIGPLLRDALRDLIADSRPVHMLVPGLAEIVPHSAPLVFTAFMSGRLTDDAAKIKQCNLGIAGFSQACRDAKRSGMPPSMSKQPKLVLRGVNFEKEISADSKGDPETELKIFAETYADGVINLQALPYTSDRGNLFYDLAGASVALMPSWHEGFGLVAWEAIAAGVPLIITKNSGVFQLLEENHPGAGAGCVWPILVSGSVQSPYFREDDLVAVVAQIKAVASNSADARRKASELRNLIGNRYSWPACVEEVAKTFHWSIKRGAIPSGNPEGNVYEELPITALPPLQTPLQLPVKQWNPQKGTADSLLLRAEEAVVPFAVARQPEVDVLKSWLGDQRWNESILLVTGAGGIGKTRLALEVCEEQNKAGWCSGFLDASLTVPEIPDSWKALQRSDKPILIVIDYAETRQDVLLALIKAMHLEPTSAKVRILLLARAAGEWWDNLPGKDPACESLLSGYATTGPVRLSPLHAAVEDRLQAYDEAVRAFSTIMGVSAPRVVPDLVGDHFDRPLYLQMAALLAIYGERPTTAEGLTKALLHHERRYWRRLLSNSCWLEPERGAEQLLALTTLAGGFATPKEAYVFWAAVNGKTLPFPDFSTLFHALVPLYPGKQGLQAVRPDLLGEALVAQALLRPEANDLLDAVLSNKASKAVRRQALTVMARLSDQRLDLQETLVQGLSRNFNSSSSEIVAVCIQTKSNLPKIAEEAFVRLAKSTKSQVSGILDRAITEPSVELAKLMSLVSGVLVENARSRAKGRASSDALVAFATMLTRHSSDLYRAGKNEEALACAHDAVKEFEAIPVKDSRWEAGYGKALVIYSNRLGVAGSALESLSYIRQALTIYQRLVDKDPKQFESSFVTVLVFCSNRLFDVGETEEALALAEDAYNKSRALSQAASDTFAPAYANVLHVYSQRLSQSGNNKEALHFAELAVEMYTKLADKNPDCYEPDYAGCLDSLSVIFSYLGREEEGIKLLQKAIAIRQRLAQKYPDRYEPEYANSLSNFATYLNDTGNFKDALKYAKQALTIREALIQTNARHSEDLFRSLCHTRFIDWLLNNDVWENDISYLTSLPDNVPAHVHALLELFSSFVIGCCTPAKEAFKLAYCKWGDISLSSRVQARPYWLAAAAWCAAFAPEVLSSDEWLICWKDEQKRTPQWMEVVAQRLDFELPQSRSHPAEG